MKEAAEVKPDAVGASSSSGSTAMVAVLHRLIGGLLSLAALGAALLSASYLLKAVLMAVVWLKQLGEKGHTREIQGLFRQATPLARESMTAQAPVNPSVYLLQALGALGIAVAIVVACWAILRLRRWAMGFFVETSFSRFVSTRYLLSRQSKTLVSLITVISILGIAVGVTALVVVISVIDGFDRVLVQRTMGVFAHLEVRPLYEPITDPEAIIKTLLKIPGVVAASPVITEQTFFQQTTGIESEDRQGGYLRGLDPAREPKVTSIMKNVVEGTGVPKNREVVMGLELAKHLHVHPGDVVYVLGKLVSHASGPITKIMPLKVVGIFRSGLYDVDAGLAYTTIPTVQELFLTGPRVSAVHARLADPNNAFEVKEKAWEALDHRYDIQTWQEINPQFFQALWMEKVAMFVILLLIVLVAAFNIIGTLIMVVSQKTREIGILKSMGSTRGEILRIFLNHGLVIGVVGTGLGLSLGLRLCWFVDHHIEKIYQLPGNVYYGIDKLPVEVEPVTIGVIVACSLLISVVASIVPAVQASRLNPVEALRYE